MDYTSQIGQDRFVVESLNGKTGGTFVDIGAGHPVEINNTVVLERDYGWRGVSLDKGGGSAHKCRRLSDEDYLALWKAHRNTPLVIGNALTINFKELFESNELPHDIDYLDLDIAPPAATLKCLMRIPFDEYSFRAITFEHDNYRDPNNRKPARDYLLGLGYSYVKSDKPCQEDWYLKA